MGTDEVEKLCNVFAENLLIPGENVQAIQEKLSADLTFDTIIRIASEYHVGHETLVRRLERGGGLTATDRWVAVLRSRFSTAGRTPLVSALAGPSGRKLRLSPEDIAWETDESVIMVHLGGQDIISDVSARHFGSPSGGYILALGFLGAR